VRLRTDYGHDAKLSTSHWFNFHGGTMADEWTAKDLIEALKGFPLGAKVYYEMGPNGPGIVGKAQYVRVWGDDEMGVLLDR